MEDSHKYPEKEVLTGGAHPVRYSPMSSLFVHIMDMLMPKPGLVGSCANTQA